MDKRFDIIIIGAGPAGMTAGIYAARAGLKVGMVESSAPGGKLIKTYEIGNWPGIKEISGVDLATQMFSHVSSLEVEYLYGDVTRIEDGDVKQVICADGTVFLADVVIVATGTVEKMLGLPKEEQLVGKGVSFCAVCDGNLFKNKVVTVIGGGNSALEESLYLTQFVKQLNIVIRRDVFRGDETVAEEVVNHPKINVIKKHIPVEIIDDNGILSQVVLEHVETKERMVLDTDGLFPYIGANPATKFIEHLDVLDQDGYVLVDESCQTKVPGIYAAGDVCQKNLRQIVTATSDGAIAAQSAFYYLKQKKS